MNEEALFLEALDKQPHERSTYLDSVCGHDVELRRRLEKLLAAHANPGSFLQEPALASAGTAHAEATQALDSGADPRTDGAKTHAEPGASDSSDLAFLTPSKRQDSLGRLEHYEVLEVVGKGGFGIVLKAFDEKLHRIVAIKVLSMELAANGVARQRFIREARTAAAVAHEHVVTIHAVVEEHRPPYLVMQMIDGVTLQQKLDKTGMLGLREILRIGMQMAQALDAAHKQGLVHRDIKPANILLENGVERVKITDFGLARAVDDASVTQSGTVAGTPMYMSPEQAEGLAVDHRSDLFSLGTVLYAMCTGHPPFRATGTMAVLKRVVEDTPRPIHEINGEIPDWLCDIIAKLHAKKPDDRFQTAKEVAELLGQRLADVQAGRAIGEPSRVSDREAAPAAMPPKEAPAIWPTTLGGIVLGAVFGLVTGLIEPDTFWVWGTAPLWLGVIYSAGMGAAVGVLFGFMRVLLFARIALEIRNAGKLTPPGPPPLLRPRTRRIAGMALAVVGFFFAVTALMLFNLPARRVNPPGVEWLIGSLGLATIGIGAFLASDSRRWRLGAVALLIVVGTAGATAVVWWRHAMTPATLVMTFRHPTAIMVVEGENIGRREYRVEKPGHGETIANLAAGKYRLSVVFDGKEIETETITLDAGQRYERTIRPTGQVQVSNLSAEKISLHGPIDPGTQLPTIEHVGPRSGYVGETLAGPHKWYHSGDRGDFSKVAGKFYVKPGETFELRVTDSDAATDGWVQLFNGKDLSGWSTTKPSAWKVENSILTGSAGVLRSDKRYENFEIRAEVKIKFPGTADCCFRSTTADWAFAPLGNKWISECTGSLAFMPNDGKTQRLVDYANSRISDDAWFTLEVRVVGQDATVRLNGVITAEKNILNMAKRGFLEWHVDGDKKLEVRKIEIKELPPEAPALMPKDELPGKKDADAKDAAVQFCKLFTAKNIDLLMTTVDVPFCREGGGNIEERGDLKRFLEKALAVRDPSKDTVTVKLVTTLAKFEESEGKITDDERKVFQEALGPDHRLVRVEWNRPGEGKHRSLILIRFNKGEARIVGIL